MAYIDEEHYWPAGTSVLQILQSLPLSVNLIMLPPPTERQRLLERIRHMLILAELEKHEFGGCCW